MAIAITPRIQIVLLHSKPVSSDLIDRTLAHPHLARAGLSFRCCCPSYPESNIKQTKKLLPTQCPFPLPKTMLQVLNLKTYSKKCTILNPWPTISLGEVDWYHAENSTFIAVAFVNYKYPIIRLNQVKESLFFSGKLVQTCTQKKFLKWNVLLKILKSLANLFTPPKKSSRVLDSFARVKWGLSARFSTVLRVFQ